MNQFWASQDKKDTDVLEWVQRWACKGPVKYLEYKSDEEQLRELGVLNLEKGWHRRDITTLHIPGRRL